MKALTPWFVAGVALAQSAGAQNVPFHPAGTTKVVLAAPFAGTIPLGGSSAPVQQSPVTIESVYSGIGLSMFAPGARLTGLAMRSGSVAWPASGASFADYTIALGRGVAGPGSLSPVITENYTDAATVVSGARVIPAGAFLARPSPFFPAPFSYEFGFASAYTYGGGHLHVLMSQTGSSVSPVALDAAGAADTGANMLFQARSAEIAGAGETTQAAAAPVVRLSVDPFVDVPLQAERVANGNAAFTGILGQTGATVQVVIAADQIRFVPEGSLITSISLRLAPGAAAWPDAESSTGAMTIEVASAARAPGAMSATFSENRGSDAIIVRDGAMTLGAGSISGSDFGTPIYFQRGFVYKGGDLLVTIRHGAFSRPGPALSTANPAAAVRAVAAASQLAADGEFLSADAGLAVRIGYTPSACVMPAYTLASGGSGAFLFDAPRVHQMLIDAAQLAEIPAGSLINGIAFRVSPVNPAGYVSWPEADATVAQCDIELSETLVMASGMDNTFALNQGPSPVKVRSGPLFVPRQAMKVLSPEVAEHSFVVPFATPYRYDGGNLCVTMRLGHMTGATTVNFDGRFRPTGHNARRSVGSSTATGGNTALSFAARLMFTPPAPTCPADFNGDGVVDDADFALFVRGYDVLETAAGDLNFDAMTDDADFSVFVAAYEALVCP